MTIFLVQHGKSVPKEEDPNRPLSIIGVQEVEEIAAQLKNYCTNLEVIYHTSKSRAAQTAEIFQKHVNATEGMHKTEGMNPMDDVEFFARNSIKTDLALYVGHLPFMEKLAALLVTGDKEKTVFKFQNAGVVKLEYSDEKDYWFISGALLPRPI